MKDRRLKHIAQQLHQNPPNQREVLIGELMTLQYGIRRVSNALTELGLQLHTLADQVQHIENELRKL